MKVDGEITSETEISEEEKVEEKVEEEEPWLGLWLPLNY